MKKTSRTLLALALALMTLFSCVSFAAAEEDVVLTVAVPGLEYDVDLYTRLQALVDEKLDGIKLDLLVIPMNDWPDYYQKLVAMAAAGNLPDMGRAAERLLPGMIANGLMYDITDYVNAMDLDKYYATAMNGTNVQNGRYYGLPSGVYTTIMVYNKDLFDAAGLPYPSADWNNPITFDEMTEACLKLASGEGAERVFGFQYRSMASTAFWGAMSYSKGGSYWFAEDGVTPLLNTPEHVAVMDWYKNLNDQNLVPKPTDEAVLSTIAMFTSGRLAMSVEGTWTLSSITEYTKESDFRFGIAANPGGDFSVTTPFTDSYFIGSQTKHPDECWKVLELLYSEEGWDLVGGAYGVPVLKSAFDKYLDTSVRPYVDDETSVQCLIDNMSHTMPMPYSVYFEEADAQCVALKDEWMLGNISSQELMDQCNEIHNRMKRKYER